MRPQSLVAIERHVLDARAIRADQDGMSLLSDAIRSL